MVLRQRRINILRICTSNSQSMFYILELSKMNFYLVRYEYTCSNLNLVFRQSLNDILLLDCIELVARSYKTKHARNYFYQPINGCTCHRLYLASVQNWKHNFHYNQSNWFLFCNFKPLKNFFGQLLYGCIRFSTDLVADRNWVGNMTCQDNSCQVMLICSLGFLSSLCCNQLCEYKRWAAY